MKLTTLVLSAIKGNPEYRRKIREALGVSEPTMTRLLRDNHDDLTKAAVLQVIREEMGLSDPQILEESVTEEQS